METNKPFLIGEEYIPYGPDWEKEMMKFPKKEMIQLFKKYFQETARQQAKIEHLEKSRDEYAIKFVNWCNNLKPHELINQNHPLDRECHYLTIEQLLAQFKQISLKTILKPNDNRHLKPIEQH